MKRTFFLNSSSSFNLADSPYLPGHVIIGGVRVTLTIVQGLAELVPSLEVTGYVECDASVTEDY